MSYIVVTTLEGVVVPCLVHNIFRSLHVALLALVVLCLLAATHIGEMSREISNGNTTKLPEACCYHVLCTLHT